MARETQKFGNKWLRWTLVGSDALGIACGWLLASLLGLNFSGPSWQVVVFGAMSTSLTIATFFWTRLYRSRMCSVRALETAAILRACLVGGVAAWMVAGRFGITTVRFRTVVVAQVLAIVFVAAGRALYRSVLTRHRGAGRLSRRVVLIGGGEEVFELYKMLSSEPELGYLVVGVVGNCSELSAWDEGLAYLGTVGEAVTAMRSNGASGAIVAASGLSMRDMNQVIRDLLAAGVHVQLFGGLLGIDPGRLQMNPIGGEAAFYLERAQLSGFQSVVKRGLDIVIGGIALIICSPIIVVFALLTKLSDGGSALFRQQRVGRNGEPFTMIKIRTMVMNAEAIQDALADDNHRHGPLFKIHNDPRFTRIGKFMDGTSINELPQLWNVLRGDMSLVGPRPALACEVATFNDRLLLRHQVRPGITGLWQVEGRDSASFATYERCDVFYVENWSTRLDLMILAQTTAHLLARAVRMLRNEEGSVPSVPGKVGVQVVGTAEQVEPAGVSPLVSALKLHAASPSSVRREAPSSPVVIRDADKTAS